MINKNNKLIVINKINNDIVIVRNNYTIILIINFFVNLNDIIVVRINKKNFSILDEF